MKDLISINNLTKNEILDLIKKAVTIKKNPKRFSKSAFEKTLLMIFEAPSLRTRISFEVAMTQMGGHAINYYTEHSPWGLGKESIEDVGKVISRYCNIVMARILDHDEITKLAENASIPVINGLSTYTHPCQILGDLLTIHERKGNLNNLTIAYLGDAKNNVTNSLMFACNKLGIKMHIASPKSKEFAPDKNIVKETKTKIFKSSKDAVKNADVIYTDSWMSYHIPKKEKQRRIRSLKPYQVNQKIMQHANKKAVFMHCLPALREMEVTKEVIDGKQSIILDQAANRLFIQKAIILKLINNI